MEISQNNLIKSIQKVIKQEIKPLSNKISNLETKVENLDTKLEKFRDKCFDTFITKEDFRLFEERTQKDNLKYQDKILTSNDKAIKKHDDWMAELGATIHCETRQDDKIENLDTRVTIVETKLHLTPATA